jgi:hypothetical protein
VYFNASRRYASVGMGGDGMWRRVIGATLTILGVLILLFEPVGATGYCADFIEDNPAAGCHKVSANSWWGLINWPAGWDKLFLPMLIIGVVLVVTGVVLLIRARRSGSAPCTAR